MGCDSFIKVNLPNAVILRAWCVANLAMFPSKFGGTQSLVHHRTHGLTVHGDHRQPRLRLQDCKRVIQKSSPVPKVITSNKSHHQDQSHHQYQKSSQVPAAPEWPFWGLSKVVGKSILDLFGKPMHTARTIHKASMTQSHPHLAFWCVATVRNPS